jgi:hypothetical protein
MLNWQEVVAAIFAVRGITSGWYRVGVRLHFAAMHAAVGEGDEPPTAVPAGIVAVDAVALFKTNAGGPMTFDAGNGAAPVAPGAVEPAELRPTGKAGKARRAA